MKILMVGRIYPWPADSGGAMRFANAIKALVPLGEVELFVAASRDLDPRTAPESAAISRIAVTLYPVSSRSLGAKVGRAARAKLPLELVGRDYSRVRQAFSEYVKGRSYDLVWVSHLSTYVAVGTLPDAPTIVDVDDLQDDWHTTRLAALQSDRRRGNLAAPLKRFHARRNASLWMELRARIAGVVDAVLVCSEADRSRIGAKNARVIPNGYDRPDPPLGRSHVAHPAGVMFQGGLTYPPNIDAARFLAERVTPLLRERVPDTQVRLVGYAAPAVEKLGEIPGVISTGWVPNIAAELGKADLVVAPIRFGGGTRIKILEAFAHRIPVVSSSFGAYGLDVVDGRHLLLADSAESFADACATALTADVGRRALADQAEQLFLEKYQWCHIANSIRELAVSIA